MEKEILRAFLHSHELKFSEIEKSVKARSNKLAYHIKNLVKKGILEKQKENYKLSETAEALIPYLSKKQSPLPVLLIAIPKNSNQVFLHKRTKRPFHNKLSLPGGRIKQGESIQEATSRILKEKHNIAGKIEKINSVSIEHVNKNKIHSFFLILTTASTKNKIQYTRIKENKSKIISSDYKLIKKDLKKEIKINEFMTED